MDYEVSRYASEIWKSIIKDPIGLLREMVELKIFEIGPRKAKYTRQFNVSLEKSYSEYKGENNLSDF